MAKVIHVHLTHGIDGTKRKDWYFSSISAVYTVLTAEQVGATKNYLLHAGLSGNGTVCTKRAIIKQSTLISCGSGRRPRNDVPTDLERNMNGILPVSLGEVVMPPFLCLKCLIFRKGLQEGLQRGVTLFLERGYKSRF